MMRLDFIKAASCNLSLTLSNLDLHGFSPDFSHALVSYAAVSWAHSLPGLEVSSLASYARGQGFDS